MTNGEKIRGMTDEELAKFLSEFSACKVCEHYNKEADRCYADSGFVCVKEYAQAIIGDWLNSRWRSEMQNFANAVLKDGKIIFWWSGDECDSVEDFYKDFYYAGLNMDKELETGRYSLVKKPIEEIGKDDREFYKLFQLHEDFRGFSPYE